MSDRNVLAADIGATHTRIRISEVRSNDEAVNIAQIQETSGDATALMELIASFTKETLPQLGGKISAAAIGVPGKISDDRQSSAISYLDPDVYVDFSGLFSELGIEKAILLNDLECGTHGVTHTRDIRLICGETSDRQTWERKFIIGMPGSGLGMGVRLEPVGAVASEGGNLPAMVDPGDELEVKVWQQVVARHEKEVGRPADPTYNSIVRANGIVDIFRSVLAQHVIPESAAEIEAALDQLPENNRPKRISEWALAGEEAPTEASRLARTTFRVYGTFLGRAMQAVALVILPHAVFLAGSIVMANHELISDTFQASFRDHVVHGEFLSRLGVYLVWNPQLNLDGATQRAVRLLEE